ncbi:MAG: NAD(P)/FAD-dependent oxidoreductase [Wenzhouxiangella sp.]|jgi:phytoene dehydrogenase-like protein|nr:NAD(P)/FAD-dependent oxidoreductase [Wenzhouxiangella sp.]
MGANAHTTRPVSDTRYDVIIIGGGHNGLVAACYLADAGKKVLILERNDALGGASVSARLFDGFDARISRYAYLVSLFPQRILRELGLNLRLLKRPISSYTPYGEGLGLLLSNENPHLIEREIRKLSTGDWRGYQTLVAKQQAFAALVWDSLLEPLESRRNWEKTFNDAGRNDLWRDFVERPLGELLETQITSDLLRGIVFTDGKIGANAGAHDASLLQNRTFLYHVIGNKTGDWQVPEGGMGQIAEQLIARARRAGVEWRLGAEIIETQAQGNGWRVGFRHHNAEFDWRSRHLVWNATPPFRRPPDPSGIDEGTSFKINMLVKKLPQPINPQVTPEQAFSGTFHIDESYSQLEAARRIAQSGRIPEAPAGEIYCHTLTDPSILSPELARRGYHTLTYFGLDLPYALFADDNEGVKQTVVTNVLDGLNRYLATPLEDCLATDCNGRPCLEAKSPVDLERELGLPRGNIFHKGLSWFFAESQSEVGRYGVETDRPNEWICGASARRGGAVSGIPGRNAAMAILRSGSDSSCTGG